MFRNINIPQILEKIKQLIIQHTKLFFLAFSIWLFVEYIILGPFSYARIGDNMDSFVPRLVTMWSTFAKFGVTNWHVFIAGGLDRLGNEIPFLHIVSFLFYIFPAWLAVGILLVGGAYLGGWYMFRLCKEVFALSFSASVIAGIVFAASFTVGGGDIIFFVPGLCIVPVILFYLEQLFSKPLSVKVAVQVLGWGLVLSLFSSAIFTLPFVLVILVVWFFFLRRNYSWKVWLLLALFAVASISLHTQELMSLVVNSPFSQRGAADYYQADFRNYLGVVGRLFYENWIALLIMIGGGFLLRLKEYRYKFVTLMALGMFLMAPLYQPIATRYGNYFPLVRNFSFDRFDLLLPFFAALGMALVIHRFVVTIRVSATDFVNYKVFSLRFLMAAFVLVVVFVGNVQTKFEHVKIWASQGGYEAHAYSPGLAKLHQSTLSDAPFRVGTIGGSRKIEFLPTLAQFHGFETIDSHANLTSERFIDFFRIMAKRPDVKSDLYFFWHPTPRQLERFQTNSTEFLSLPLISLSNTRYLISRIPIQAPHLSLLQEFSSEELQKPDFESELPFRIKENFTGRNVLVYENQDVLPRFFLTKSVSFFGTKEELLSALEKTTSTSVFRQNAFLNSTDIDPKSLPQFSGSVEKITLDHYSPDMIELTVESDGPSFLVILNTYNPFWKVTVNGNEQKIVPAYHAFMGVVLEAQKNKVVLTYSPPYKIKF
jgi:hypothetical protein